MNDLDFLAKILGNTGSQVKTNFVHIATLRELLIEKGIITFEEYERTFEELYEETGKEILEFLKAGTEEYK